MDFQNRRRQAPSWNSYRMLTAIISWVQSTCCCLALIYFIIACCDFALEVVDCLNQEGCPDDGQDTDTNATALSREEHIRAFTQGGIQLALQTLPTLLGLLSGILLIFGVKQENFVKVQIWLILEVVSLAMIISGFILELVWRNQGYQFAIARDLLEILFCTVSLVVVGYYFQELFFLRRSVLDLLRDDSHFDSRSYGSTQNSVVTLPSDCDHNTSEVEDLCTGCTFVH